MHRCVGCSAAVFLKVAGAHIALARRCCSNETSPPQNDPRTLLQQLQRPSAQAVAGDAVDGVSRRHPAPSLLQITACCEQMCQPEAIHTWSAEEWSEAVQLLLHAMARAKQGLDDSAMPEGETVEKGAPWASAMRLFLREPPQQGTFHREKLYAQQLAACEGLLRCCTRHGAPVDVGRAVYKTLRTSTAVEAQEETGKGLGGWHVLYVRFLMTEAATTASAGDKESARALQKEALRVLLLDAAEDGVTLLPAGLLLSLEVLRCMVTDETAAPSSEEPSHNATAEEMLWSELRCGSNVVTVARDVCCRVLRHPHASRAQKQEAFCRFVAVGMQLTAEQQLGPFACAGNCDTAPPTTHMKVSSKEYVQLLNAVSDLLDVASAEHETVVRLLAEPCVGHHRHAKAAPLVYVWFLGHILRALASFKHQAAAAAVVRVQERKEALLAWEQCTQAALWCLQRVLLQMPAGSRSPSTQQQQQRRLQWARQEAFSLLFQAVLDGVFCSNISTTATAPIALHRPRADVMATLTQLYGERDWRGPSVCLFIECLHTWRLHDVLRHVFCTVYRREEWRWRSLNNGSGDGGAADAVTAPRVWRSSLRLSTCQLVVQSACAHDDPATAALAVKHMLRCLLAARSATDATDEEESAGGERAVVEGRSVAEWTRIIHDGIIPRVDEVFHRTGIDTTEQWLGSISGGSPATVAAVAASSSGEAGGGGRG
ncbi:hypothetical protein DQ04_03411020 [Trypanosoma grayi]|uniref:hypothetical protein n=1 Tax=Trypanosoma grayi TaxID=71804 RepID=UPI0004F446B6|nr:hypothetical protein DQ04_03411020 [Trypanosoma grayi]KEG10688.1 hypothetical protein DQ04_03411020 [Trypanosoma grayi]